MLFRHETLSDRGDQLGHDSDIIIGHRRRWAEAHVIESVSVITFTRLHRRGKDSALTDASCQYDLATSMIHRENLFRRGTPEPCTQQSRNGAWVRTPPQVGHRLCVHVSLDNGP